MGTPALFYVLFLACLRYGESALFINYSHTGDGMKPTDEVNVDTNIVLNGSHTQAYDLVDESEYASNYWDCSTQNEKLKQKNLIEIGEMLQKGEQKLDKTKQQVPNVVLVLGNAGVGKTTLVQFMAGDDSKLISADVGEGTGEYLIEDGNKIGSSTTESQTLFPELVTNESDGTTYCDTPGFSDTRSPNHAVLATYLMRTYLKNFDRIKIVLMVTYNSVQLGMYKDDFMNLLRNLNNFIISNYDNYKNNILLVATKVPNNYVVTANSNMTLVSDENLISSIAKYINKVRETMKEKFNKVLDREEKEFLANSIKILNCLKEKDENGNYKKINIFRRPSKAGPLNGITLLQNNKMSLRLTIQNGTGYTELYNDDIGYTLSDTAKNHLDCLLLYINEKITKISKNIFQDYIKPVYENKIDNSHDVYELLTQLKMTDVEFDKLKNYLDNSQNVTTYINKLNDFIMTKNITDQNGKNIKNYENKFNEVTAYISKIEQFSDTKRILKPITWTAEFEPLKMLIKDSVVWHDITIRLYEYFSTFKVQKSVTKYANETRFNPVNASNYEKNSIYKFMMSNSDFLSDNYINSYFNQVTLNDKKIKDLEEITSVTLNIHVNITCNNQGKLTVSGHFVKISEINKKEVIQEYCGEHKLQVILIKAIQTFFIDDDLNDDIFKGIDVIVIAPKWEIIGARIIKLDGKDGNQQKKLQVDNETDDLPGWPDENDGNSSYTGNPEFGTKFHRNNGNHHKVQAVGNQIDGLAGLPGENGGTFFGIGMDFVNGISLQITSNGGNGGPGQNGENGENGPNGDDGSEWIEIAISDIDNGRCSVTSWQTGSKSYSIALSEPVLNDSFGVSVVRELNNHELDPLSLSHNMRYERYGAKLNIFTCRGEEGGIGGNGGHGAVGGFGGHEGSIRLVELEQSSQIQSENKSGKSGTPGKGGKGGDGGENGSDTSCYRTTLYDVHGRREEEYWRCGTNTVSENNLNQKGADGLSNHSTVGLIEPMKPGKEFNYSTDILEYVLELQKIKKNKFLSRMVSKFRSKLIKQWFQINYKSLWRLIVAQDLLDP